MMTQQEREKLLDLILSGKAMEAMDLVDDYINNAWRDGHVDGERDAYDGFGDY